MCYQKTNKLKKQYLDALLIHISRQKRQDQIIKCFTGRVSLYFIMDTTEAYSSYLTSVSFHELGCVMILDQALQTINALHLSCKGRKEKICARISSGRSIPFQINRQQ